MLVLPQLYVLIFINQQVYTHRSHVPTIHPHVPHMHIPMFPLWHFHVSKSMFICYHTHEIKLYNILGLPKTPRMCNVTLLLSIHLQVTLSRLT